MSTRCIITIEDRINKYRIYRHHDGYPNGVISDLKILLDNKLSINDPEYFLANFIFYAKLNILKKSKNDINRIKSWELGYGVCSPTCEHDDLAYKYTLSNSNGRIIIEEKDYDTQEFKIIFNGNIKKAIEKYSEEGGYHISPEIFL